MQQASRSYKAEMRQNLRNHSYMRVTIGVVNQLAQSSAWIPDDGQYAYYSDLKAPLNDYRVEILYGTCDQDYTRADGSMYFLPREKKDVVLNQGIVTETLFGAIEVRFPIPYDLKGLTVEFGHTYPVDFQIQSDHHTARIQGNREGHFVTDEIFWGATFLRFVPETMSNGQGRLHIYQLTMGIGICFDDRKIRSVTRKEHISPIMEELPTIDLDLTVDVMEDAGIDERTYWFDTYLKDILVKNPMPPVAHREALQLIANAGRCILCQDRSGKIFMKSSFIPDMEASSESQTYFSHADRILDGSEKEEYGLTSRDFTNARSTQYFLPREETGASYLNTGYISEETAGGDGAFLKNPIVDIQLEAAYKCFGLCLEFGQNPPEEMVFHAYRDGELQEDHTVTELSRIMTVTHEFPEFDRLVLEFTKGPPDHRIVLHNVTFGDSTDYKLAYGTELTRTPKGTQLPKVKELQVIRTLYQKSNEEKELAKENVLVTAESNRYTVYFSNPSYGLSVSVTEQSDGRRATIVDSSSYFATIEITGGTGSCEVVISGREYITAQAKVGRQLHTTGSLEVWENPLISEVSHGADLAEWIGDYMRADREYDLQYRGEPRLDANDLAFLENKYVPDLLLRIYDHTLKFNGALSGTIKARRDMGGVAATKNRLVRT